jgi:hypothetical protein
MQGSAARAELATKALSEQPEMTAPQLAAVLANHGHAISVHTAQRLKAKASD